jgi:hypothetical protein
MGETDGSCLSRLPACSLASRRAAGSRSVEARARARRARASKSAAAKAKEAKRRAARGKWSGSSDRVGRPSLSSWFPHGSK